MRSTAIVLILGASIVVGCGGGDDDGAASTSAVSETTTTEVAVETTSESVETTAPSTTEPVVETTAAPTAPPTTLSTESIVDAAGAHYLAIVRESNCAQRAFFEADESALVDWQTYQRVAQPVALEYADTLVAFLEELARYQWPENVRGDVDALMAEVADTASFMQSVGTIETEAAFVEFVDSTPTLSQSAASTLRAKLSLPTNIGADQDDC